ncbi:MAG TPA: tRNA guanosine(34) transglycosylase Tgt [Candidatus Eremiobacteraceae bacterium]|nr:tRNA guanosine(34) transglycosylase Tgt [Candidatus Eremiobacteraceae bacterium]
MKAVHPAFTLEKVDGEARAGVLHTRHGDVPTPVFMPVGTQAAVKGLAPDELHASGARIILANAYHCYLRPGAEIIGRAGGLHGFMSWDKAILTDSGGFQVFSLSKLSRVDDTGYHFSSHLDGTRHTFTPESVVALQETLRSDIAMVLDDVAPSDADRERIADAARRTLGWAERSLRAKTRDDQLTFAIVQGATFEDVRRANARDLVSLDFPGYAIGGLWLGEDRASSIAMTRAACDELPVDKPRYLMGVGTPEDLLAGIGAGVDMFDCVYPTRCARHALALTSAGRLNLRNARFADDFTPLDDECDCAACAGFTRAYLAHCMRAGEMLGARLISLHNITFMIRLASGARDAILSGRFADFRDERMARLDPKS